jgi:cellular nucleic acid-binding protein
MVFIYALQLEEGKYYIGKTNNPQIRLENHFNFKGSEWTKIYNPINVLEMKPDCDDYDEDKTTLQYMDKFGIDNVRGGSFVSVQLDDSTIKHLKKMSNGTNDRCFICSLEGHFAKDCPSKQKSLEKLEPPIETFTPMSSIHKQCNCFNSMFTNHFEKDCALKSPENFMKGISFLGNKINNFINEFNKEDDCCFRCGRKGHYASSCYASKDIKGFIIKNEIDID